MGICGSPKISRPKATPEYLECSSHFTSIEIQVLYLIFTDLGARSAAEWLDKDTFLSFFPLTGLWGQRLFKKFDTKHTNHIDFNEFLGGLIPLVSKDRRLKAQKFFKMYDQDDNGFIEKSEFQKMLFNYPKEEINKITEDFVDEYRGHRNLAQYESVSGLKSMTGGRPNDHYTQNESMADIKLPGRSESGLLNVNSNREIGSAQDDMSIGGSPIKKKVGEDFSVQDLGKDSNDPSDVVKDGDILISMAKKDKPSMVERHHSNMDGNKVSIVGDGKKKSKFASYRLRCTTLNNRIKQYVDI
jgi:Ca2+-binding EF-hand superfamily protein